MLSLPDFREKQILFIQAEESKNNILRFQNDNILYRQDEENVNMISCYKIFAVFIIGDFSLTTNLIRKCQEYGISLFLLKKNFEVYAEINSQLNGNYLLREKQYGLKNELDLAKKIIENKIYNQLTLLKEQKMIDDFDVRYENICEKIKNISDCKELLGLEGGVSKDFFKLYFAEMNWLRRMPRSKYDVNNVLLDIGYTFLFNFIDALLSLHGFDNYKGFYHKLFFQRKSLSCDVMEPFRCLIDKQLLKSFRLKQINEKDFKYINNIYVLSYDKQTKYLKIFFDSILEHKEDIFLYVKNFYYFIIKNQKDDFPFFKIK